MTDYGHELEFGVFVTPANRDPQQTVALARLSDRAGLDLVTFQDHPYQPAFLDTWTLLSWVAAQTERIRVTANVINLPLRPPAVLARAAASLDLLSGGRVELALGAGAFWDAIVAMGGTRLTPGQSVDALEEAIDIIRAIWSPEERRGVNLDGAHYHLRGAKRGPEPAHDMAIWVGALKPRMLDLVGRKADGWLPTLKFVGLEGLEGGNAAIDAAAERTGRDPREIRRLVNIHGDFAGAGTGILQRPPDLWVQEVLPLALELGVSTFILASDDPREIETYANEVAPGLREAVAAARGRSPRLHST